MRILKPYSFPRLLLALLLVLSGVTPAFSQTYSISGRVVDSLDAQAMYGATVVLVRPFDTTKVVAGAATDTTGAFVVKNISPGPYRVKINFTGYYPHYSRVFLRDTSVNIGTIKMRSTDQYMKIVTINDKQVRISQNGDTMAYNANAYKTNPDATAEDLVGKLPGMTNDGGTLKHNGEEIKQVTVDGKPYMGEDPSSALKNIPADMIDQVQVFDKSSDQSQFTGFDDGNSKKTINIVTKKQAMNGQFGKIYAGYGTNDRYNAGTTLNLFNGAQRLTILGMSNNINQQNFSMQDLFGGSGGSARGMMYSRGGGGGMRGGGPMSSFMVPQQSGISTTHAFGLNYSDEWGPKIKVSGSYFFNYSENANTSDLTRSYFASADSLLSYVENSTANTRNINHRFNFKFEYTIDSMNALVISPRLTTQFTDYSKSLTGVNKGSSGSIQSNTMTTNASQNLGYTFSNNITYRHRFNKTDRTLTFDLSTTLNERNANGSYYSRNIYSETDTTIADQVSSLKSNGYTINPTLTWTEKAGKNSQLLINYSPSLSHNWQNKETDNYDPSSELYSNIDSLLSNKYTSDYLAHRGGIAWKYNKDKLMLTVGSDFQYATLTGNQEFPSGEKISEHFNTILPNAQLNYKFDKDKNLRVNYRTSANAPSISQLQNVIDNSNPLQLKTGNPDLRQDFQQTIIAHFGKTNPEKATGFFTFLFFNLTQDYIGNSTFIAGSDTTLPDGTFLNRGSQLSKPVNLNGYRNGRLFLTYSFAIPKIKCNLGVNLFGNYSHTPALINGLTNFADGYGAGPGLTLSSNISEKVDFTLGYNGSYNLVRNSIQSQSDNNYFTHTASFKFNLMPYKGLVLNTSLDQTFYSGLGAGYNTNYLLWNASVGYKFLKNKSLEVKASAFDLLKQNTSVSRNVTETYIEDTRTNTLQNYYMLTVTWNIKNYKKTANGGKGSSTEQPQTAPAGPPGPHPGNPPPGPPPGN